MRLRCRPGPVARRTSGENGGVPVVGFHGIDVAFIVRTIAAGFTRLGRLGVIDHVALHQSCLVDPMKVDAVVACDHDRRTDRTFDTRSSPIARGASHRQSRCGGRQAGDRRMDTNTAGLAFPGLTSRTPSVSSVVPPVQADSFSVPSAGSRRSRSARSQSSRSAPSSPPRAS